MDGNQRIRSKVYLLVHERQSCVTETREQISVGIAFPRVQLLLHSQFEKLDLQHSLSAALPFTTTVPVSKSSSSDHHDEQLEQALEQAPEIE